MLPKRACAAWLAAALALQCLTFARAAGDAMPPGDAQSLIEAQTRTERALLVGVDDFVSRPSIYPSSTNNVYAMQEMFQGAQTPFASLLLPETPVTSAEALTALIRAAFADAREGDVSYFYISTHGVYNPVDGVEPVLLLSDGATEGSVSPSQLRAAFDGILGTKVLILDACNSGAFIGKGMPASPQSLCFLGDDFKVLTSSGALEESWYWSADEAREPELWGKEPQGAFYFTQALAQGLDARSGYPADQNHDGSVTLKELYDYLLLNHAASTPQVYPQSDDFVIFRYDLSEPLPTGLRRSPIMDVTFSGNMLDRQSRQLSIEFIATRPVRVAYQVVYQREGKWEFANAQLIYDEAERFTAFGDRPGAVSAGRKVRTLSIGELTGEAYGYVLVQLVTIDQGKLTVHAGRVLCVPPETGELNLGVQVDAALNRSEGRELSIFVAHAYPCTLSVVVLDQEDRVVRRLCHRRATRPMQMQPEGSAFYWDGKLKDGEQVDAGVYRVRAQAVMNDVTVTAFSDAFTVE